MNYLEIANSPLMWAACMPVVLLVLALVFIFVRKTLRIAKQAGIPASDCFQAFRTGMITAIGPSVAVFIVMVGLMSAIGGPMSWMRLSVIGSADAELLHAGLGASAIGQTLSGADYDVSGYAASIWGMSIMGISWLITVVFIPRATQLQNMLAKKDRHLLQVVSVACMAGIMAFMTMENVLSGWDMTAAAVAAAACVLLLSCTVKKLPWLKEYHMGISMIVGMIAGALVASI